MATKKKRARKAKKTKTNPAKRRTRRTAKRHARKVNPSPMKRRSIRRRRNPGSDKIPYMDLLIGAAAGTLGTSAVWFANSKYGMNADGTVDSKAIYIASAACAVAGAFATKFNTAAGLGLAGGGVAALAAPMLVSEIQKLTAPKPATVGALYGQPTPLRMGAVQAPPGMGAVYQPNMGAVANLSRFAV